MAYEVSEETKKEEVKPSFHPVDVTTTFTAALHSDGEDISPGQPFSFTDPDKTVRLSPTRSPLVIGMKDDRTEPFDDDALVLFTDEFRALERRALDHAWKEAVFGTASGPPYRVKTKHVHRAIAAMLQEVALLDQRKREKRTLAVHMATAFFVGAVEGMLALLLTPRLPEVVRAAILVLVLVVTGLVFFLRDD